MQIIQTANVQELSSLFMTHHLSVMHAPMKSHEYTVVHMVQELWPGHGLQYGTKSRENNSKNKNARVAFLVHDPLSQCDARTGKFS